MNSIDQLGIYITNELTNGKLLKDLSNILSAYDGMDWSTYINIDKSVPYFKSRAYIDNRIEIVIITWSSHQSSKIHDHPMAGCLLRVMVGSLIEDVYDDKINLTRTNYLNPTQISYQIGNQYLHQIKNETDTIAVSLHIYSPPNYPINMYQ